MQRNFLSAGLILALVLHPARVMGGEVYKCIDSRGHTSYQDMNCGGAEVSEPVERRYANTLSMPVSRADVKSAERFDVQRGRARQRRLKRLRDNLRSIEKKTERCRSLKASYLRMQARHRPQPHTANDSSSKANLIRRMRAACSD